MADNVPGRYYVGDSCLDCDLCRATAPDNFERNNEGGYSFVKKQPETPEEEARCREAMEGCCTATIHDDGNAFDWAAFPPPPPFHQTPQGKALREKWRQAALEHRCCGHPPNFPDGDEPSPLGGNERIAG